MAELWSELEGRPLPEWAVAEGGMQRRPVCARETRSAPLGLGFRQWVREKVQSHLSGTRHYVADYLDYCRMRRDFICHKFLAMSC